MYFLFKIRGFFFLASHLSFQGCTPWNLNIVELDWVLVNIVDVTRTGTVVFSVYKDQRLKPPIDAPCLAKMFAGTGGTCRSSPSTTWHSKSDQGSLEELVPCNLGKCSHLRNRCFFLSFHVGLLGKNDDFFLRTWQARKNQCFFSGRHIFNSTCKQFIH